jgi:acetyl esterase/lipase
MTSSACVVCSAIMLGVMTALAGPSNAGEPEGQEPPIRKMIDIPYSKEHTDFRKIDVFLPGDNRNGACIFFIHGGGWAGGKKEGWHAVMEYFARRGYVCTSANYRLAPDWRFPAHVEDVRLAMSFVKERAEEYGFDRNRVASLGSSAGAHLVAMLATIDADEELGITEEVRIRDTKPNAAVLLCGVLSCRYYECESEGVPGMIDRFFGVSPEEKPELAAQASPLERIDGDEPPFLMVVGDADPTTPVSLHEAFREEVLEKGGEAELVVLPGVKHGFGYGVTSDAQKKTLALVEPFLEKTIGGKKQSGAVMESSCFHRFFVWRPSVVRVARSGDSQRTACGRC